MLRSLVLPVVTVVGLLASILIEPATAQNSTRKIRQAPSEIAARAGSAVPWRPSVDAAIAEAKETGRPVFWYVPTVRGSRMDRKPEIDRYMLAGPFSWPPVFRLLRDHFVPVRAAGGASDAERYGLRPLEFVEPGFLILDGEGQRVVAVDELTTLHPDWFVAQLLRALPEEARKAAAKDGATGWFAAQLAALDGDEPSVPTDPAATAFLAAARVWASGDEAKASEGWTRLVAEHPEDPWAWKAAMELEGHGPFVNGFELLLTPLPNGVLEAAAPHGTRAPAGFYDAAAVRRAGLDYFVTMQRSHGGFVDSRYDFGGTDSLPNVHAAVTALVAWAILETLPRLGGDPDAGYESCLQRAFTRATDDAWLNRADRDELIWAHLYRTRLCARWLDLRPADRERVRPVLERAVADIVAMQPDSGAWFHEYANPFVIASCLVALHEGQRHGVAFDHAVVERGIRALMQCRAEDGAVSYGYSGRGAGGAQIAAGVGRVPLAEHALLVWEHGDAAALARGITASFEHHQALEVVRKYDDHASPLGYGGFFFWYDLHVRGEAIGALADEPGRISFLAEQRSQILAIPEIDGCFVDSHELGRVYGTAMALICLAQTDSVATSAAKSR